jgi:hypothetical protein
MLIRRSEHRMRYTEEKDTRNNPKSHALAARVQGERSAYLPSTAIATTAVRCSGRSLWTGSLGPGLPFSRLRPRFQIPDHLTTPRRLIICMEQARTLDTPLGLASSTLRRFGLFRSYSIHMPSVFPTNLHSLFFSGSPAPQPFQPLPTPFPQVPASADCTFPRRRFSFYVQDAERGFATLLPTPCAGCAPDRWNTIPDGGVALQRDHLPAVLQGKSDISSQGRGNGVYASQRKAMNQGFYLFHLDSWHSPFGPPSVGELRSPYGLHFPAEGIIPSSVIQTHYMRHKLRNGGLDKSVNCR